MQTLKLKLWDIREEIGVLQMYERMLVGQLEERGSVEPESEEE